VVLHPSSSHEQQSAERLILGAVSLHLGSKVTPRRVDLPGGAYVNVDGVADEPPVFVEVYAHQGRLRGGQRHKIAGDILKLLTLGKAHPGARLVLAFADIEVAGQVQNKGWLAEAIRTWSVEVFVADLPVEVREGLRAAQGRQVMVNPPSGTDPVSVDPVDPEEDFGGV